MSVPGSKNGGKLHIISMDGKKVIEINASPGSVLFKMDVSKLKSGAFGVQFSTEDSEIGQKFLVE